MGLKITKNADGTKNYNYSLFAFDFSTLWSIAAVLISWATHKSIGWAIFHYCFGFLYIIYWAITGDNANEAGVIEIWNYYKGLFN